MIKPFLISFLVYSFLLSTNAQNLPQVSSGKIERIENFKSQYVDARNIDIWLPDNYNSNNKYAVVYMQDGQMLFDSLYTWNKKEWQVDETVSQLIKNHKIEDCIIVGVWNNGKFRQLLISFGQVKKGNIKYCSLFTCHSLEISCKVLNISEKNKHNRHIRAQ
jgi:hypothetical protein